MSLPLSGPIKRCFKQGWFAKIRAFWKNWQIRAFWKKLETLDLGPIAFQLNRGGWNPQQTQQVMLKYRMFLLLVFLSPNMTIVPTREIDEVWHHHILDTNKYASDCQKLFGRLLHHFPYFGLRSDEDRQNLDIAFAQTKEFSREVFGTDVLANSDNESSQEPAVCEPLRSTQSQDRPRADVEIARVMEAFPFDKTKLG